MKLRCLFKHKWKIHAIDSGFNTSYRNGDNTYHVISYIECECCGKRRFTSTDDSHSGIKLQKNMWMAGSKTMNTTDNAEVFDWRYFRDAGIRNLMHIIRTNPNVKALIKDQPTVGKAIDQLETTIKMCSDL